MICFCTVQVHGSPWNDFLRKRCRSVEFLYTAFSPPGGDMFEKNVLAQRRGGNRASPRTSPICPSGFHQLTHTASALLHPSCVTLRHCSSQACPKHDKCVVSVASGSTFALLSTMCSIVAEARTLSSSTHFSETEDSHVAPHNEHVQGLTHDMHICCLLSSWAFVCACVVRSWIIEIRARPRTPTRTRTLDPTEPLVATI